MPVQRLLQFKKLAVGAVALAATALVAGCGPQPGSDGPTPQPGRLLCHDGPYDLGASGLVGPIAAGGGAVILGRAELEGSRYFFRYDLIDTRDGSTWSFHRSLPETDGSMLAFDRSGDRVVSVDYPVYSDQSTKLLHFRLHDRRDQSTVVLPASVSAADGVAAIADDLTSAVLVSNDWLVPNYRRIDLRTGVVEQLPPLQVGGWGNVSYSPSTELVLQTKGPHAAREYRVLAVDTGDVVAQLGTLELEDGAAAVREFVDDDTILFDSALLPGMDPGTFDDDNAFLYSVSTERAQQIDPGVAGADVLAANAGGTRLVYRVGVWPNRETRVRTEGVDHRLGGGTPIWTDRELKVALTEEAGNIALLHCL